MAKSSHHLRSHQISNLQSIDCKILNTSSLLAFAEFHPPPHLDSRRPIISFDLNPRWADETIVSRNRQIQFQVWILSSPPNIFTFHLRCEDYASRGRRDLSRSCAWNDRKLRRVCAWLGLMEVAVINEWVAGRKLLEFKWDSLLISSTKKMFYFLFFRPHQWLIRLVRLPLIASNTLIITETPLKSYFCFINSLYSRAFSIIFVYNLLFLAYECARGGGDMWGG